MQDFKASSFQDLPLVGKMIRDFDIDVGHRGLPEATREFLTKTKTKILVEGDSKEIKHILKTKAVILVANHEHDLEPFVLTAAFPHRQDIYMIGIVNLKAIGRNFAKHLIPVYVRPESIKRKELKFYSKISRMLRLDQKVPPDAHERNIQSINQASNLLQSGSLIMMCPAGARKKSVWSPGIGHLIKGLDLNHEVYYVKAYVSGVSNFDFLRIVPGVRRILPTIKITFAQPERVRDLLSKEIEAKALAKKMQDEYNRWVKSL